MSNKEPAQHIAVVGVACRFPGAESPEEFWHNLKNGIESVEFLTDDEISSLGLDESFTSSGSYVNAVSRLKDIESFDADFWGVSPAEAQMLDPQQRLMLELAQESFDDAGFDPARFDGHVGVFTGIGKSSYLLNNVSKAVDVDNSVQGLQVALATDKSYSATRISYVYDLDGPSLSFDTACSTSLVAVHNACRSILDGECDAALVGGAQVNVPHGTGYCYSEEGIFSRSGHCRSFDASAEGTIFGNGGALILLKRLEDAVSSNDQIYAVIRGSASVNDGAGKVGFIAPGFDGQRKTLELALKKSGIAPDTLGYLEAHGSGTALGDVIEVSAASAVYGQGHEKTQFCGIGSVKSNIGHLETAAGIAGLTKTLLALKNKKIPPTLNFTTPNTEIDFPETPFYVNTQLRDWPLLGDHPRRAAVTSIGLGGTNAHVVLEEAPEACMQKETALGRRSVQPLFLSAKTSTALDAIADNLAESISEDLSLEDVAFTLAERITFDRRMAVLSRNIKQARSALKGEIPNDVIVGVKPDRNQKICFMFPGQGSQYVGMAQDLYALEPVFKATLDHCFETLKPLLAHDLKKIIYPDAGFEATAASLINQTAYTQPALFAVSYSLAQLWISWGVTPSSAMGHSVGEFVAACLAGVFTLDDALKIIVTRGRLMQSCESGAMVSVPLSEKELQGYLNDKLHLGAVNGPKLCVASGTHDAAQILINTLSRQGIEAKKLHISIASHSPMMDEILEEFHAELEKFTIKAPNFPLISNVSGTWVQDQDLESPQYWVNHLRSAVRFSDGIETALTNPDMVLLEVGPGQALSSLAKQTPTTEKRTIAASSRHPKEVRSDIESFVEALARLWVNGVDFDSQALYLGRKVKKISLPTYQFERKRHWISAPKGAQEGKRRPASAFRDVANWFYVPMVKELISTTKQFSFENSETWLVFVDKLGLGRELLVYLENNNQNIVKVVYAERYTKLAGGEFGINPSERSDYSDLIDDLITTGSMPHRILHLWNVSEVNSTVSELHADIDTAFYSPLYLVQALSRVKHKTQLTFVTNFANEVVGGDLKFPYKSLLLGAVRTTPIECPYIDCQHVDLDVTEASDFTIFASRLLKELHPGGLKEIALRRGRRWERSFSPVSLDEDGDTPIRLRDDGVYLITGGLGGIGLSLVEAVSARVDASFILTSRSAFPSRNQWQTLAAESNDARLQKKLAAIAAIEAKGSRVYVHALDVSSEVDLKALSDRVAQDVGPINGIIHSAGIAGNGLLASKTRDNTEAVLCAKYYGTDAIDKVFDGVDLDFIILKYRN